MLKAFSTCIAMALLTAPVLAQELTTQRSEPDIIGNFLIHSGRFTAQRSTVAGGGDCEAERRVQVSRVFFDPPYREPPQVFLNLNTFEFAQGRNARIGSGVANVTRYSATIAVWTWCDTNLYQASGTYFALGELHEFAEGGELGERGEFGGQGEFSDRGPLDEW